MDDKSILGRIQQLVDEEHALRQQVSHGEISSTDERAQLAELEEALDQCWDLLRRRRSARGLGNDPDAEQPRDTREVEDYLQ
jgi:hypothetical protein